jgi:hypothetical protein
LNESGGSDSGVDDRDSGINNKGWGPLGTVVFNVVK